MKRITFRANEEHIELAQARARAERTTVSKQFQLWLEVYVQKGREQLGQKRNDANHDPDEMTERQPR